MNSRLIGYFTKASDAQKAVAGKDINGNDGDVTPVSFQIFESFSDFEKSKKVEIKQKALAKLSEEEKEALGLA